MLAVPREQELDIVRLLKAQVRSFRCVEDSEEFSLADVTCLVGKNESGKTAILKALHKLKPEDEEEEQFEASRDYPRRRWLPGKEIPTDPPAITTRWQLDEAEHNKLEEHFGRGALPYKEFTVSKGYDNERVFEIAVKETPVVKHVVAVAALSDEEQKPIADAQTMEAVRKGLEALATPSAPQQSLLDRARTEFGDGVEETVIAAVEELMPTFLYFADYQRLAGQVSIDELVKRKAQGKLTNKDRILSWSGRDDPRTVTSQPHV